MSRARSIAVAAVLGLVAPAVARAQTTIPLNLDLGDVGTVSATVTADAVIQNGQLLVTGSVSGTATVRGITGTVNVQPVTLALTASCNGDVASLTLSTTSNLVIALSDGTQATVAPLQVTVVSRCANTATLTATVGPTRVTISDGTTLTTTRVSATISSPNTTPVGTLICAVHDLACQLARIIERGGPVADALAAVNQALTDLLALLG